VFLLVWLLGWLVGLLGVGGLVGLVGWLADWQVGLAGWLVCLLLSVAQLTVRFVLVWVGLASLFAWLGWFGWLIGG